MNLILFAAHETEAPLAVTDPRAQHLRRVLRRASGELFDCGIINGPRGSGWIAHEDPSGLHLSFAWGAPPPPLDPVWLLVGLPRPQTARKILGEIAAIGVAGLCFFAAERGEESYASSRLWSTGEAPRLLLAGVAQAFCTRMPACERVDSLAAALTLTDATRTRIALDNYEAVAPLARIDVGSTPAVLAIGPERGWSANERAMLRAGGFSLAHLGPRVLRTETACVAGLALLKARLGLL